MTISNLARTKEASEVSLLIADDHDMLRQGVASLLVNQQINNRPLAITAQAKNGKEALRTIKNSKPDIAILDISMPELNGLEVCEKIQRFNLDTRVIILTMHEDVLLATEAVEAGAMGYVLKDNAFDELIAAIEAVIAGKNYISAIIKRGMAVRDEKLVPLSNREQEVLRLLANGRTVKHIAQKLEISTKSVDTYRQRLLKKLGMQNSAQLIQYATRRLLV